MAYCGLLCSGCPIYLATREEDEQARARMISEIVRISREHYGVDYSPEDITDCDGCPTEGERLFSGCMKCTIRACARDKGLANCASCDDYPCGNLTSLFTMDPGAKTRLDVLRSC